MTAEWADWASRPQWPSLAVTVGGQLRGRQVEGGCRASLVKTGPGSQGGGREAMAPVFGGQARAWFSAAHLQMASAFQGAEPLPFG